MAKYYRYNGSEISPCIIAQVRFILGISKRKPKNKKTCSKIYWNEVLEIIAKQYRKQFNKYLR